MKSHVWSGSSTSPVSFCHVLPPHFYSSDTSWFQLPSFSMSHLLSVSVKAFIDWKPITRQVLSHGNHMHRPNWMAFFVLVPFTQLAPSHPSRLSSRVTPSSGCLLSNTLPTASLPPIGWDGNASLSSHLATSGCLYACTYHITQITYTIFSFLIVIIKKKRKRANWF